jgi:ribosomal protein L37AE/L43A
MVDGNISMANELYGDKETPEIKEIYVSGWTAKKKYDCPECGAKKSIKHPNYQCKNCKQIFKLKMKMNLP